MSTSYDDALRSILCIVIVCSPFSPARLIVWDVSPSLMTKDAPFPHFGPLARIGHNCQTVRIFTKSECACETLLPTTRSVLEMQGKWLSLFKAQWSQNPDVYPHFTVRFAPLVVYVNLLRGHSLQVGDMDHSIDIFGCKGDLLAKLSDRSKCEPSSFPSCALLTG